MKRVPAMFLPLLLGACGGPPMQTGAGLAGPVASPCETPAETGTRLPRKCGNPNVIRAIGSQAAQEDADRVRSLSNVTGVRGN